MIVDAHTHIFPASLIAARDRLLHEEPEFAALYADPAARMATDIDLLRAMDEAGVDHAVIAGFAWRNPKRCRGHNEALLEATGRSGGRLLPFCAVPHTAPDAAASEAAWCLAQGAHGLGELRPEALGPEATSWLAALTSAVTPRTPILLHASEPVGHAYPGKEGGPLTLIWRYLSHFPEQRVILAHLGGGLPWYAHMPEVRARLRNVWVDTAAAAWLFDHTVVRSVVDLIGAEHVLFGSDYPLRHPRRDRRWLHACGLDERDARLVLGDAAAALFGLNDGAIT